MQCATGYTPTESVTGGGLDTICLNGDLYAPNCIPSPCLVPSPVWYLW